MTRERRDWSLLGDEGCQMPTVVPVEEVYIEPWLRHARGNQRMSDTSLNDKSKQQIRHLRELIAALDRRVPRIERVGEADIARDAAELKKKALARLAELQADVEQE